MSTAETDYLSSLGAETAAPFHIKGINSLSKQAKMGSSQRKILFCETFQDFLWFLLHFLNQDFKMCISNTLSETLLL